MRPFALVGVSLAALVLPAASAVARPSGGTPVALVTAETENQLIAVSLPDGKVLRRVAVAADPENVVANQKVALVVSPGSGAVSVLDARTLRTRKVLHGLGAPHLAALDPSGKWAFVTDDARGQLDVVSLTQLRIVKRLFVGTGAHHLSVSRFGKRIWIALGEHAHQIAIVDTSRPAHPRLLRRFDPGLVVHDLAFSPDGRIWVTSATDRAVRVLSPRTGRALFSVQVGPPPQHVVFGVSSRAPSSLASGYAYAYLTSGYASRIELVDARGGRIVRIASAPYGSFNVTTIGSNVVTSSLIRGTVTDFDSNLRLRRTIRVAPAARGVAGVVWP
jgi:DNA-binding beta-propeller fold protein YncE